ncbi:MAG: heparinase II/III family protein [Oceanipulchritudo sp.]
MSGHSVLRRRHPILLAGFLILLFNAPLRGMDNPGVDIEEMIARDHPRVLASKADFEAIRNRRWDSDGNRYWDFVHHSGQAMLGEDPVTHSITGLRLLHQSRRALKRILTWSLLYRVEGEPAFRDRAIAELETVVAFPDWNPSHFLDVGEMALAVAIGTDWLWDDLTPRQRSTFLAALRTKALLPSLDEEDPANWWIYQDNNWNPVCHSGLVAASILVADDDPELAERVITRALKAVPAAFEAYHPDGAYPEGPVYWDYGTSFSALFLDLMETAFGSRFGLDAHPAFRNSGTFRALVVSPTGKFYNYADSGETARLAMATAWFASRYNDPAAFHELKRGLGAFLDKPQWDPEDSHNRLLPLLAFWYPDSSQAETLADSPLPTAWLGRGPNPVAIVREEGDGPERFYLGFKGNQGSVSHAHLDAGSFVYEDAGVRWAIDLGNQNYNSLESLGLSIWDRRQHSDRWRIFRLGSYSHNVLLIDQRSQDADSKAAILRLDSSKDSVHGVVDLTPVHQGQANRFERHFHVHDKKVLQIVDVIEGARALTPRQGQGRATFRWRMLTRAKVSIEGNRAILSQNGRECHLVVPGNLDPLHLKAEAVDPPPYFWDAPNPGITAIDVWTKAEASGNQSVEVLLSTDPEALAAFLETR